MRIGLVLIVLLSFASSTAAQSSGDYCKGAPVESPSIAGISDVISARYLLLCSFPKETKEVRVKAVTETEESEITIEYDGSSYIDKTSLLEKSVPVTVSSINVRVRGKAPSVEKSITALSVSVYVDDGKGFKGYQNFEPLKTAVSKIATGALKEIDNAKERLREAESRVASLQSSGADVSRLRSRITDAKGLIDAATSLDRAGNSEKAKETAKRASEILDEVLYEARGIPTGAPDYKRYAAIFAAIVLVAVIVLYIKSRREELG